jgi:hypothetical protein
MNAVTSDGVVMLGAHFVSNIYTNTVLISAGCCATNSTNIGYRGERLLFKKQILTVDSLLSWIISIDELTNALLSVLLIKM